MVHPEGRTYFAAIILFLFLFSPLFSLSAQEEKDTKDYKVEPLRNNTYQDGMVEEEKAKKFIADEVTSEGKAPEKVIKLTKSFKPPDGYLFRPFRPEEGDEVFYRQVKIAIHKRKDPIDKMIWKFWNYETVEERPKYVDIWFDPQSFVGDLDVVVWEQNTPDGTNSTIFGRWKSIFNSGVPFE